MLMTALDALRSALPPLEVAVTFGALFFVLSWVRPRPLVTMPVEAGRRTIATLTGTVGGLAVAATSTWTSTLAATTPDTSGYDGWWQRPLPLLVATVVVAVSAAALRGVAATPVGDRAVGPRRSWHAFAPRGALRVASVAVIALLAVAGWHTVTATSAPPEGPFFSEVPEWTALPIFTRFSGSFGYLAGAGWPNHLATLVVVVLAVAVVVRALRSDADRAVSARETAAAVRADRAPLARVLVLVILAGLLSTLGSVLMHVGASGYGLVGLPGDGRGDGTDDLVLVAGAYDAIARPMNVLGHLVQGIGFALGLRLAVDTLRARASWAGGAAPETQPVTVARGTGA